MTAILDLVAHPHSSIPYVHTGEIIVRVIDWVHNSISGTGSEVKMMVKVMKKGKLLL